MAMDIYSHQDSNIRKTWLLMAMFLGLIIAVGWVFSHIYDNPGILFFAVVFSIGMNVFSYWFSDTVVIKMSGAKPVTKEEAPELWNIVENLSITAGLPMPKLYTISDPVPNAFATGRNKEHAAVAVTTGILGILDRTELEGVIAHELSHIGNRDILISTVAVVLAGFIALLSDFFLRASMFGNRDNNRGGAVFIVIGFVLALLAPLAATIMRLAISRKREFLADASGALLTRYPEGLASALEKIHARSAPMKKANHATAHLYISNPFGERGKQAASFMTKLFMTHPPVEERIRALRGQTKFEQ